MFSSLQRYNFEVWLVKTTSIYVGVTLSILTVLAILGLLQ